MHKIEVKAYDFEKSDETWLQTVHIAEPEESLRESISLGVLLSSVLSQLKIFRSANGFSEQKSVYIS